MVASCALEKTLGALTDTAYSLMIPLLLAYNYVPLEPTHDPTLNVGQIAVEKAGAFLYYAGGNGEIFVLQIASDGSLSQISRSPFNSTSLTANSITLVE
jgi:hypothetical protein